MLVLHFLTKDIGYPGKEENPFSDEVTRVHNPLFEIPGPDTLHNSGVLDCRKVTNVLYVRCEDVDDVCKTHTLSGINITEDSLINLRQLCKQINSSCLVFYSHINFPFGGSLDFRIINKGL